MAKGRPKKNIDEAELKDLMRFRPSLADTAAWFDCSEYTTANLHHSRDVGASLNHLGCEADSQRMEGDLLEAIRFAELPDDLCLLTTIPGRGLHEDYLAVGIRTVIRILHVFRQKLIKFTNLC